jgi:hypothetical protein
MPDEKTVPYERFAAVVAERKDLRAQLDAMTADLATAKTAAEGAEAHKQAAADWQAKHADLEGKFGRHRALTANGITDPDVGDLAEWAYGRLPERDRPTFDDALKAWKAKPEDAPAALRPHLIGGGGRDGASGGGGGGAQGGASRGAAGGSPAGGEQIGADAIMRLSPAQYRKDREVILSAYRNNGR